MGSLMVGFWDGLHPPIVFVGRVIYPVSPIPIVDNISYKLYGESLLLGLSHSENPLVFTFT